MGEQIDTDLYSRQLYVLGLNAMKKMAQSNVFLSGLDALGVETAKNVILAGVKSFTVHDTLAASWLDLSGQFFIRETDIGKNRAEVSAPRLAELNPYVAVKADTSNLNEVPLSFFDQFNCVVLVNAPLQLQLKVDEYCRSKDIPFVSSETHGLLGSLFCDFGREFEIQDKNGEEPLEFMIADISKANPGVVKTITGKRHGLESGDHVRFSEVLGMTEINNTVHKITVTDPFTFTIGDTSTFSAYTSGGLGTEIKTPQKKAFLSLKDSQEKPEITTMDFAKFDVPAQLHIARQALHAFAQKHGHFPRSWNAEDAAVVYALATEINGTTEAKADNLDENLFKKLSFTSQGHIAGVSAFLGGVGAQEILKALSGKFTPLQQWAYLDVAELVPDITTDPAQFQPRNDRYDALRIVVGGDNLSILNKLKLFMVGSGAIGCEMLKNFAMMGIGTDGLITITDNDLIEKSNLNRQFLFRSYDIGHPKSESAARAVRAMNPDLKTDSHTNKVSQQSENIYTNDWWSTQDLVVNALDNIEARLYVDSRCVYNRIPLLESGTMGTKGHVQVIVPHQTANYGSTRDPPEAGIPFCTLKSFPSQIDHCIQWARDKFNTLFSLKGQEANQLIEDARDPEFLDKVRAKRPRQKEMKRAFNLLHNRPKTAEDCIRLARRKFESYYNNSVQQLLHAFPLDKKNDDGTSFWALPRRPPTPLSFDPKNELHVDFIVHAAHLFASVYGVKLTIDDQNVFAKVASEAEVPIFQVRKDKHIETNEQATGQEPKEVEEGFSDEAREALLQQIWKAVGDNRDLKARPEDFEKDDDTNHHIDFITAASNIRATQYGIQSADRLKTKKVAGKIIPAMATSTAAITGLAALEILKIVKKVPLEQYKNAWMNLAIPMVAFSEPQECPVSRLAEGVTYTLWDRWEVREGDLALGQLINHFKKHYKLVISAIIQNTTLVYSTLFSDSKKKIPMKMSKLLVVPEGNDNVELTMSFQTLEGEDVQTTPPVVFYFRKN